MESKKNQYEYDVAVLGGGTAGTFAAVAAARQGVRTVLIEESEFLGGQLSAGMGAAGAHDTNGEAAVLGLFSELEKIIIAQNAGPGIVWGPKEDRWIASTLLVQPERLKSILFDLVLASGVKCMLKTTVAAVRTDNNRITAVDTLFAGIRQEVRAKIFIDATGNGSLGKLAGAETMDGDGNGRFQSVSMVFSVANINLHQFEAYMNQVVNTEGRPKWTIVNASTRGEYWMPWRGTAQAEKLPKTIGIYHQGNPGEIFINAAHAQVDCLDVFAVSEAIVELRRQAFAIMEFLRQNAWGCENAYISGFAPLGVRESRRICGRYIMTKQDLEKRHGFADAVCRGAYPPDVHQGQGNVDIHVGHCYNYEIPLRALISKDFENLLMCGRCISADSAAAAGLRGMGVCIAAGEAAGVAASLSAQRGSMPAELCAAELQNMLRALGVNI